MTATPPASARLDKWLWCVRLFKTRSLAMDACRAGSIRVNEQLAKPARDLRVGEVVTWRQGLVMRTVVVLGFPLRRVNAKEVTALYEERTRQKNGRRPRPAGWGTCLRASAVVGGQRSGSAGTWISSSAKVGLGRAWLVSSEPVGVNELNES